MEIKRLWETYAPWKDINADIKHVRECNFATLFLWTVEGSDSKTRWVLAIDGKREEVSLSCTPCITDTPWTSVYKASASKNWNKWDSLPWFSVPGQFVRYKTKQKNLYPRIAKYYLPTQWLFLVTEYIIFTRKSTPFIALPILEVISLLSPSKQTSHPLFSEFEPDNFIPWVKLSLSRVISLVFRKIVPFHQMKAF